jgi:hypothetical protein
MVLALLGSGIRDPRPGIRDPEKTYSGSRIQGSKRHRIPDPDPQHWLNPDSIWILIQTKVFIMTMKIFWIKKCHISLLNSFKGHSGFTRSL